MGRVATLRDIQAAKSFADKFVTPWLNKAISFFGSLFETVEEVETTEEDEVTQVVTFAPEASATPVVISNEGKFVELAGTKVFYDSDSDSDSDFSDEETIATSISQRLES